MTQSHILPEPPNIQRNQEKFVFLFNCSYLSSSILCYLFSNFCVDKNTFTLSDPWLNTVQLSAVFRGSFYIFQVKSTGFLNGLFVSDCLM